VNELPLSDLNGGDDDDDDDDDEDEILDDGEFVDENDTNFELKSTRNNSRKRKTLSTPKVAAKKTKTKSQSSQMFIDPGNKETLEKRLQILEGKMTDLEIQNKQLRHQLATSTETVGTKKKLHSDFPYMVEARNYWDGMGKGSVGDSISCVLMEVFSPVELSNSSISGEGNGTKLQKLDPQRISALIAYCLFIPYPPSKSSIETSSKVL